MTQTEGAAASAKAVRRGPRDLAGYVVLGVAVLIAIGVGAYLAMPDDGPSPVDAVRQYYQAVSRGGADAGDEFLAPDVRESPIRQSIPFSQVANLTADDRPPLNGLEVSLVDENGGWAQVRATGNAVTRDGTVPFDELQYVQQVGGEWLVSTRAEFARSLDGGGNGSGSLGMIDSQRPTEGNPAPDFALLDAQDGTTVRKLSDYRGKAVVLNWYASWCGPCKQEIPDFEAAYQALGDQLVILGVDYQESAEKARSILAEFEATYPAVLDSEGSVAEHYRVSGMPTTYFIDAQGVVRGAKTGRVTEEDLAANLAKLGLTYTAKP